MIALATLAAFAATAPGLTVGQAERAVDAWAAREATYGASDYTRGACSRYTRRRVVCYVQIEVPAARSTLALCDDDEPAEQCRALVDQRVSVRRRGRRCIATPTFAGDVMRGRCK